MSKFKIGEAVKYYNDELGWRYTINTDITNVYGTTIWGYWKCENKKRGNDHPTNIRLSEKICIHLTELERVLYL